MTTASKKSTLTLDDLDHQYNPQVMAPARIKAALARLGDHAMTASNFAKESRVPTAQLVHHTEEFDNHIVVVRDNGKDKTLWCGTEAFAKKVKERLGI